MKPQLLKVTTAPAYSFSVRQDKVANHNNRWHYHPEIELIHFHWGAGTQFIGDSIKRFTKGDIVLVGSNLPHYWRDDEQDLNKSPYSTVIHFSPDFWGERFLELAENKPIKQMLEKAQRGLLLSGDLHQKVALLMDKILRVEGTDRIIVLLEILLSVSRSEDYAELSSLGYQKDLSESDSDRINAIYNYTLSHFNQKITLSEIAGVSGMVPNAFCRYFKSRTGKTYSQFLTEIRVGHSCRMLMESDMSIKQLCFESGFMNFSCFHKRFKSVTGQSPQSYRHAFIHAGK
ncbi:MAG: AraC family transcriptional regulator [Dyadobacter sp.]|uniref:AraC family transcriptional regulator n=1 Tax=Dyadobacter sp. TaxID=1914288 RepID=UPI0032674C37